MPQSFRITFIAGEYPPLQGGLGDYTRELGRALSEMGHAVRVVTRTTAETSSLEDSALSTQHSVHVLRVVLRRVGVAGMAPGAAGDCGRGCSAYPVSDGGLWHAPVYQRPALAPSPAPPLPLWERGTGGEGKKTLIAITYHDTRIPYLFPKAGRVRDWVTDLPGRGADLVIATNAEDGARLQPVARHLALIPIGSNIAPTAGPDARPGFRTRWGIGLDTPLLVYFGFVNRAKGADTLMEALARLRSAGLPAHLMMLGGQVGASDATNAQFLAEIKRQAQALGVASAITWTDFVPEAEVSAALMSADMAVLPYRDGVSLQRGTLMAALTHGLPIVTTRPPAPQRLGDTGGIPGPLPVLADDVNAALVPPNDPQALADAIAALWADPTRRARLGEGGRTLSLSFHWDRIAAQHVEEYTRLRTKD